MAKVKDVLPMVLAGLAGAASPQGAEVFTNIANTAHSRRQDEAAAVRRDDEMAMRKESHGAQMKLRDLAMADREKKAGEEALDKVKLGQLGEYYSDQLIQEFGADNPIIQPALGLLTEGGTDKQTLKNIYDTLSGRARKEQEKADAPTPEARNAAIEALPPGARYTYDDPTGLRVQGGGNVPDPNVNKFKLSDMIGEVEGSVKNLGRAEDALQKAELAAVNAVVQEKESGATYGTVKSPANMANAEKTKALEEVRSAQIDLLNEIELVADGNPEKKAYLLQRFAHRLGDVGAAEMQRMSGGGPAETIEPSPVAAPSPAAAVVDAALARPTTTPTTPTPTRTPAPNSNALN